MLTALVIALFAPFLLWPLALIAARVAKWWQFRALEREAQRIEQSAVPDHSSTTHYAVAPVVIAAHHDVGAHSTTEVLVLFALIAFGLLVLVASLRDPRNR